LGKVVIVAGFQGVSYKREITTLGRGGSDTTAVALAAALNAEACEIYSDVPGVFSADPRIVPDAFLLGEISFDDMQELASSGAKVLNAQAVSFCPKSQHPD
jgi:aspartate kinase